MEYENNVFFDILAEDLARRDMEDASIDQNNYEELSSRIDAYIAAFEQHGTDNIPVSYTHLDVYKRQKIPCCSSRTRLAPKVGAISTWLPAAT